jgi:outer membrane protein assembly factor BamD (BamD/ComL family)
MRSTAVRLDMKKSPVTLVLPICTVIIAAVLFAGACKSGPVPLDEDMTPSEVFQLAQEAAIDKRDYETALHYYQQIDALFPTDEESKIIADYEIAFLHYKMGNMEEAKEGFEAILDRYLEEDAGSLPPWPPVLAEKLLVKIEEE